MIGAKSRAWTFNLLKHTENGAASEKNFRSGPVRTMIPGNQSSVEYMK